LFVVFTAPFRTGIALTAPEHFHGTYQEIVTPQGAYARAKVRKNDNTRGLRALPHKAFLKPLKELLIPLLTGLRLSFVCVLNPLLWL